MLIAHVRPPLIPVRKVGSYLDDASFPRPSFESAMIRSLRSSANSALNDKMLCLPVLPTADSEISDRLTGDCIADGSGRFALLRRLLPSSWAMGFSLATRLTAGSSLFL